ncbi:MAG: GvpL/GvpF family gas vesicle protein [Ktedonobacterales bacterium]
MQGQSPAQPEMSAPDHSWGWYLYGVIRAAPDTQERLARLAQGEPGQAPAPGEQPLELLASGELLAVVRGVPLADFSPEAISAHADDPAWLEQSARRHNSVIEAVHRGDTMLPAKFGSVYPRAEDVRAALRDEQATLRDHLAWLDGCDEWGVRLYGDLVAIRQRGEAQHSDVARLRQELEAASPGRAYLLRRKLADAQASVADDLLNHLIAQVYDQFAHHARAGLLTWRMAGARLDQDDAHAELMRAAFLVPRDSAQAFIAEVGAVAARQPELWSAYSGPWAPYSFAAQQPEEASDA